MTERPSPEYPLRSDEDIRLDTLVDGGGVPLDTARRWLGIDEDETPMLDLASEEELVQTYGERSPISRRKRHNVRDYESDRDHDEYARADSAPFTPEELLVRNEGLTRTQSEAVDEINHKAALKRAGGNERLARAMIRAAQNRRTRDKSDERPQAS